jgi:hypothetical protein
METQLGYWRWKLFRWNDHPNPYLNRSDLAFTWLTQFQGNTSVMLELRELLSGTATGGYATTDPATILQQLANKMASGEIQLCAEICGPTKFVPDYEGLFEETGQPDLSEMQVEATPNAPAEIETPPEPTLQPDNDALIQAGVLKNAAEEGVPFCEECEKALAAAIVEPPDEVFGPEHDQVAQVEVLKESAEAGVHFCELCSQLEPQGEPEEEDEFGPDNDVESQVKVLKESAQKGSHFCAICEKMAEESNRAPAQKRLQPSSPITFGPDSDTEMQSQVLREASENGDHFCALCEEARKEQERPGNAPPN